jgi:DNA-binding beta-propeller fold protein YncE
MANRVLVTSLAAPIALTGCHSSDDLPSDPPKTVVRVASEGFQSPSDAVASPDGRDFYFTAFDTEKQPALFHVSSTPGATAQPLAVGDPLESPLGLVLSCDGATAYVGDIGGEAGGVFGIATRGGEVSDLAVTGIVRPGGLAMGPDCKTLFATGRTEDGMPAVFRIATSGGAATPVWIGEPLVSPTGLHVDEAGVSWVMDHRAAGEHGEGVLFAIAADGSAPTEVASDLRMGTFGGVSLTAGGGTAVMPTLDADGRGQLTSVDIASGTVQQLAAPELVDPAGLRTARQAGVFAVVDSEGGAIYRAQ